MRLNITARRFKLTEDLKLFTEQEIAALKKHHDGILDVEVILGWEKKERLDEINIKVEGKVLSSHYRSEDMKKSITLCTDKAERQLKKYKQRTRDFAHETLNDRPLADDTEL